MSVKRPQCVKNHILRNEISDVNELGTRVITGITTVLFSANWSKNLANTPSNGWVYSLWHDVTTQYVGYANMPMQIGRCCSMQFCSFIWVLQREMCHHDTAQYNMMFNTTHTISISEENPIRCPHSQTMPFLLQVFWRTLAVLITASY